MADGSAMAVVPDFLLPGRKYPIHIYLYAISLYCSNPGMGQREAAAATRREFGLATFSHTTLGRAFRALERSLAQAASGKTGGSEAQTQPAGEAEQMKLSLMLSAARERGCALSEGDLVAKLVGAHGQTLRGLSELTGRSKAWLSRRQTMARSLEAPVREMVAHGAVCARAAEGIVPP